MHPILDAIPYPFALPAAQAIERTLYSFIYRAAPIEATVLRAGILPGAINFEQPAYLIWHKVLEVAANQGRTRALIAAVREEPAFGMAVGQRLDELLGAVPIIDAKNTGQPTWRNNEVLTGDKNRFMSATFLARGAALAASVVRLNVVTATASQESAGTGLLIQRDLVLTNHHVLFTREQPAARVSVRLDYDLNLDTTPTPYSEVPAIADSIEGEEKHDWAVIRLETALSRAPIDITPGTAIIEERAYIIQHPAGGPKMIVLHDNPIRYADRDVVQYLTDTLPGSSGAPVFNGRWEVIALHHQSVSVQVGNRREIRNEGIAIGRVRDELKRRGLVP